MIQRICSFAFSAFISFGAIAAEPLSIAVSRTPLCLPFYVAEHEGYFAAEGVQVRIEEVIGGHRAAKAVLDGVTDMGTIAETGIMFNSFKRNDFAILASFVNSNDVIKLVTRAGSGITTISDLAGKRVAITTATSSQYFLDTQLILSGVDYKKVHIVNMQPEAMAQALLKEEVAAVAVWDPFPFEILASVPDAQIVSAPRFYTLTYNLVASRKLLGKEHDDDIVKLLRALDRAQNFIAAEPGQAQAIMKSRLSLEQSLVNWIWPRYNYRLALDQSLLTTLENEARWARMNGHVQAASSPSYLDFIYAAPLRQASPNSVSIAK